MALKCPAQRSCRRESRGIGNFFERRGRVLDGIDKLTCGHGPMLPSAPLIARLVDWSADSDYCLSLEVALNTHFFAPRELTCQYPHEASIVTSGFRITSL